MPPKSKIISIKRVVFDADAIAKALHVPGEVAIAKFKDGRVAGQWGEVWAASLYEFVVHGHANVAGTDGQVSAEQLGHFGISVKSLTKRGVKFQQSVFVGKNRPCTKEDLIKSIAQSDRYLIVDVRNFPQVDFIPLPSIWLSEKAHDESLTKNGWSAEGLYAHLQDDGFEMPVSNLVLP